jgi:hypothetical protein
MEASAEGRSGYLDFSRVSPGELLGMGAALVLLASLWLPWFTTSSENPNSRLPGGASGGDSANAWEVFATLDWLLVSACAAPFILTWIIARGHDLTWKPGEVTMIVGIVNFVLILCNGHRARDRLLRRAARHARPARRRLPAPSGLHDRAQAAGRHLS